MVVDCWKDILHNACGEFFIMLGFAPQFVSVRFSDQTILQQEDQKAELLCTTVLSVNHIAVVWFSQGILSRDRSGYLKWYS
ncbi:hypothetical protein JTE90_006446 [Oedothorax gibbosus]|uniref:Uncharacterized protein n=1 Tax=Oedothorax gibbosus TaxID=931172 RepID=A0AAV6TS58_9ARAC|nr:hypothetical protein JTE90_006446 [Oedothorax gibbosus]